MPDPSESNEPIYWGLKPLAEGERDAAALNQRVCDAIARELGCI